MSPRPLIALALAFAIAPSAMALASPGQSLQVHRSRDCTTPIDAPTLARVTFAFPRDDAPHNGYAVEWWRSFGRVADASGERYDYIVELQRFAIPACAWQPRASKNRWVTRDIITTTYELLDERTRHVERGTNVERAGSFGSIVDPRALDIDGRYLHVRALPGGSHPRFALTWHTPRGAAIDIVQTVTKHALPLGPGGVMVTGTCATCRAYAYAYTRNATSGTIRIDGVTRAIWGSTWFEHEYAHRELAATDVGWDRYTVSFDDGRDLDVRFTRDRSGATVATSGTFVAANATVTYLSDGDAAVRNVMKTSWRSDSSGVTYPSLWSLRVGPPADLGLATVEIALDQESHVAERPAFYAGAIVVERVGPPEGDHGHGYVELTGYDEPLSL
jgi:predicted secreted hydrolase